MGHIDEPAGGAHRNQHIPRKVARRSLVRAPQKRKLCLDDRNYVFIPFTITGELAVADYGPNWPVDRNYWIARITASCGRHDSGSHPDDGTPSGTAINVNMRRITADESGDAAILGNDTRLRIQVDHHHDAINDAEDGPAAVGDFAILRLYEGEEIYPRITQVGSGRPGTGLVVTAVLVPIP